MTIKISIVEKPPTALIKAALEFERNYPTIKEIVFASYIVDTLYEQNTINKISNDKKPAAIYMPEVKTIVIDLYQCIITNKFPNLGISLLPSIWLNMLFHFYHEVGHALQVERDTSLVKINKLHQWFENEADEFAKNMSLEWCMAHPIPKLHEMGWARKHIENTINNLYHSTIGGDMLRELEIADQGGVVPAERFAFLNKLNTDPLYEAIDKEEVGIIINGKRYLTAADCIGAMINIPLKNTAKGAQNQKTEVKTTEEDVLAAYNEILTLEGGI